MEIIAMYSSSPAAAPGWAKRRRGTGLSRRLCGVADQRRGRRSPGLGVGAAGVFQRTDVTDEADGQAAIAGALSAFGRLDGLVNCAGIAPAEKVVGRDGPHRLEASPASPYDLVGTFNMLRLAADVMSGRRR